MKEKQQEGIRERGNIKQMAYIGMSAALLAVLSQLSIPMPGGAPMTLQIFGVALLGVVFGWKTGAASVLVYLCIGLAGLPIFANFKGGLGCFAGTTGGYLISFPVLAAFAGIRWKMEREWQQVMLALVWGLIGLAIVESMGAIWWSAVAGGQWTLQAVALYSLAAFVPKDILLITLAVIVGRPIRRILMKAGLMEK